MNIALEGSIKHHEELKSLLSIIEAVEGPGASLYNRGLPYGTDHCPLCTAHYSHDEPHCQGCVIAERDIPCPDEGSKYQDLICRPECVGSAIEGEIKFIEFLRGLR